MNNKTSSINTLAELWRASLPHRLVNGVTLYRTISFPFLVILLVIERIDIFKWLLIVSYLTDAVDGYLARKFKVTSVLGAKLDSIGDVLTVLAAIGGLFVFRWEFIQQEMVAIAIPIVLFLIQLSSGFIRYGQMTSFHTYMAKITAVLQGFFLCAIFLFDKPVYWLFYTTVLFTCLELIEEIIITAILPVWKTNVKGLYWILSARDKGSLN
jgi:CDP-diacylglycerol--glycerol-3-phosphate 3-phosphatidyltransferase